MLPSGYSFGGIKKIIHFCCQYIVHVILTIQFITIFVNYNQNLLPYIAAV